jgi:phosphatidate cytidylyltransferase
MTWKRVATAVVLIPFVLGLVLYAPTSWVAVALGLVTILAMLEYFSLGDAIGHRAHRFWTASCALLLVYLQWTTAVESRLRLIGTWELRRQVDHLNSRPEGVQGALFVFVLGLTVLTLWTRRPLVESLPAAGISSSALLLVAFPMSFAVRLHSESPWLLLFALAITWANDTVAYFVGRAIGKHKLAPHLSPNKTWEGSLAGLIGSLLVGALFSWEFVEPGSRVFLTLPQILGMAALGNIAGQFGDLLESAYKRSAGVKDSGVLLPGHGGVLDRIDALILAIPVVWYYWTLMHSPVN